MEKFGYAIATKMLVDGNKKVRYMYREIPDNKDDSGWRFLCGEETQEYVNDPRNIRIYSIDSILIIDNSIKSFLGCAPGVSFQREGDTDTFVVRRDSDLKKESK